MFRRSSARAGVASGLLVAAGLVAAAQQPAPDPQQPPFRSGVQIVEVDVRVFDTEGRFVTDLTREDFEIAEEGVPQTIEAMLLVGAGASSPVAVDAGSPSLARPAAGYTPSGRQTWIFFFDLNHLTPGSGFDRARKAVEDFVRERFREGDLAGILAGDRMINNRLTSVRKELLEAARQVKPRNDARSRYIEMTREWPRIMDDEEALRIARQEREWVQRAVLRACSDDRVQCDTADGAVRNKGIKLAGEIQGSSLATLRSLNTLASGLARMPGPKTVVFLSDGFVAQQVERTVRGVVGQIARAGARVYAIDVRGLDRAGLSNLLDQNQVEDAAGPAVKFDTVADGPNSVAVDTGGLMIRNENNIGRALDRIAEDSGRYYVLAYQPTNSDFDGKYREIRVRVKREAVRVRARAGYLALPTSRMLLPQPIETKQPDDTAAGNDAAPPAPATPAYPPVEPDATPVTTGTIIAAPSSEASVGAVRLRPGAEHRVAALADRDGHAATGGFVKKGWEAYQRGDLEAAEVSLSHAAAGSDLPAWGYYALGMSQAGVGRIDAAIASWERVRLDVPDFAPVYMDLADTYAAKGDLTTALAIVREAEKRWPESADVQSAIGVIHVRRGAIDEGIQALEAAAAMTPEDALTHLNLGRAYALRFHRGRRYVSSQRRWVAPEGDRQKAIAALRKCVELGGPYAVPAREELSVLEWSK